MEEQIEGGFRKGFGRDMTPYLQRGQQKPKGVDMRHYDILDKMACRLAQYELPGSYTSEENREKLFEKYHLLYDEITKFYDRIIKDYPEPTVK